MAGENEMIGVVQKARSTMMLLRGDLHCDKEAYATGYQDASLEKALNREMESCNLAINSLNNIAWAPFRAASRRWARRSPSSGTF